MNEYARRPKLEKLPKKDPLPSPVSFKEVESAIGEQDREKTAVLMRTFLEQKGIEEAARRLLLLGSGYLNQSLGHSVSCTAFILLEMMEQKGRDHGRLSRPWPTISVRVDSKRPLPYRTDSLSFGGGIGASRRTCSQR